MQDARELELLRTIEALRTENKRLAEQIAWAFRPLWVDKPAQQPIARVDAKWLSVQ